MKSDCLRNTCPTCTESHEIKDMIFRRDTDALIKKVCELQGRLLNDNVEYYEAILDGSWPQAVTILEVALENAKLMKSTRVEDAREKLFATAIIVNGKDHLVSGELTTISYVDIVELANHEWVKYKSLSVTYHKGHPSKPEGILFYNSTAVLKQGMIFNVADTSNA